ncbi:alpha/beta fold hydrolase [bacterium]|nr:alpha/beta fold hydrolase [bacterium]
MLSYKTYFRSNDAQWVTFIHGAGGSSSIWFKQIRDFKASFNILLIDLRGHGRSKGVNLKKFERYSFNEVGNDVIEVLDHLKIKSSHFVGISLGTVIIRELSERYPDRIDGMVLGGAILKINTKGQFLMRLGVHLRTLVPYLLLYRLFAFVIMPKRNHRHSRNFFIQEARKLYQKEFIKWFALVVEVNPLLSILREKDPGIKALYVMGGEDHMFLPSVKRTVAEHSSAALHIIQDCGHVVNIDRPAEFNKASMGFLSKLSKIAPA